MRTLEALVFLANLLAFVIGVSRLPRVVPWTRHVVLIAFLVIAVQLVVEGPRWQMAPAYMLAGMFFLTWLLQIGWPTVDVLATHSLARGMAVGLGVLGLAMSALLPSVMPVFRFPPPSGPYGIGTITYHMVDAERQEIFNIDPAARRELVVQVWYPARRDASSRRSPYLPDADVVTAAFARVHHLPEFFLRHLKFVTTNAAEAAPMAGDSQTYPVLVYLAGLTGFRQMSTFQVEELVSQGYVVVALDQPHTAASVQFPDGRQVAMFPLERLHPLIGASLMPADVAPVVNGRAVPEGIIRYLAHDALFVLNQLAALNRNDPNGILTGRLDLERVGVFGVSLGGIIAGEACLLDLRFRACLVMDAPMTAQVVRTGLKQPSMWITRDAETMRLERARAGGWSEDDIHLHLTTMRAVFERLPANGYLVEVPGAFHSNFMDLPLWFPLASRLGVTGPIDGKRAHDIINAYTLAFFDRHVKGQPTAGFEELNGKYPEVHFESR